MLTYTFVALLLFVGIGLVIGGLIWGFDPLTSLTGTQIPTGRAVLLIGAAALADSIPLMAIASVAFLLSTITHNSAGAVVGTLILSFMMHLLAGSRAWTSCALPALALRAVRLVAGIAARTDRLGADRARRVGVGVLRDAGVDLSVRRVPAAGRGGLKAPSRAQPLPDVSRLRSMVTLLTERPDLLAARSAHDQSLGIAELPWRSPHESTLAQ